MEDKYTKWVEVNLTDLRKRYGGEWIAVYNDKVLAHNIERERLEELTFIDGVSAQAVIPYYVFIPRED